MNVKAIVSTLLPLVIVGGTLFGVLSRDKAEAAVTYEPPLAAGADPFTSPADVAAASVGAIIPPPATPTPSPPGTGTAQPSGLATTQPQATGTGPAVRPGNFGGTGFTTVCDRELLIRQLQANPSAMLAWGGVHGIANDDVPAYIRSLRPSSLAQDTRVTNHRFRKGQAVPFQSIQPAGTAVLIDDAGRVVARCRCGNPLLEPKPVGSGTCAGCPKNYKPPALLPVGQVPAVVTAINPPPVTGGTSTPNPASGSTSTGGVTSGVSPAGRWVIVNARKVSGPETCTSGQTSTFTVKISGSQITIQYEEKGAPELKGTIAPDGRYEINTSGDGYTQRFTGRFNGDRLIDGRAVLTVGDTQCVSSYEAERRGQG